jgi:hypothetical protein
MARVAIGATGPFTKIIYLSPWWEVPLITLIIKYRKLCNVIIRFLKMQYFFHIASLITCIAALLLKLSLDRSMILTITVTLIGLSSVSIALITVLTSYVRGYGKWLWLVINDSGIKISLVLNMGLMYWAAGGSNNQSLAFSFVVWLQLLRSIFIAMQVFEPNHEVAQRIKQYADDHFQLFYPAYERRLFLLGNPAIRAKQSVRLRIKLALADLKVGVKSDVVIQIILNPNKTGMSASVSLAIPKYPNLRDFVDVMNSSLKDRFTLSIWKDSPAFQMYSHAQWFSENAAEASKQHHWAEFNDLIDAYATLTERVCKALSPLDGRLDALGSLLGGMIYTWNAPTEALASAIAEAPTLEAQKTCFLVCDLLHKMRYSTQSISNYLEFVLLPTISALLFRRRIYDIRSVGETMAEDIQHSLLHYRNDVSTIEAFYSRGRIIREIVESIRMLQVSFSGQELALRQIIAVRLISSIVGVGGFKNNGESSDPPSRDIIRGEIRSLMENDKWQDMIGVKSQIGLILSSESAELIRQALNQVEFWII